VARTANPPGLVEFVLGIFEIGGAVGDFRLRVELTDHLGLAHLRGGHCLGIFGPEVFEQALRSLALEFDLTQLGLEPLIGKARRRARLGGGRGDRRPAQMTEGTCDHVDARPVFGQVSSQVELALELERPEHRRLMAWSHWSSRLAMNGLPPSPEGLVVFFWRYSRYSFSSLLRSALSSSRALVISFSTSLEFC